MIIIPWQDCFCVLLSKEKPLGILLEELQIEISLSDFSISKKRFVTNKGGVVSGKDFFLQAQNISIDKTETFLIHAEGNIQLQYQNMLFTAEEVFFDPEEKTFLLKAALMANFPWAFNSEWVVLNRNQELFFLNGHMTTLEERAPFSLYFKRASYEASQHLLRAERISLYSGKIPLFWVPFFKINLDLFSDIPIRLKFKWGGEQGPRIFAFYDFIKTELFRSSLRFDYRFNRGPGGGVETDWKNQEKNTQLSTINYIAKDNSIYIPEEQMRFRFQGRYQYKSFDERTHIKASYDKLSDRYMATDYADKNLDLLHGDATMLDITHERSWGVTHVRSQLRINSFETMKQEIPTIRSIFFPVKMPGNIFLDGEIEASFLDFSYTSGLSEDQNFQAGRALLLPRIYGNLSRYILYSEWSFEPKWIFYTENPSAKSSPLLSSYFFSLKNEIPLYKRYSNTNIYVTPFLNFFCTSSPSVQPNDHYIFDLYDGLFSAYYLSFGSKINLSGPKKTNSLLSSQGTVWVNLFLPEGSISTQIPKIYLQWRDRFFSFLEWDLETAWDFQNEILDHFNFSVSWTISSKIAFKAAYRTRSPYAWRKSIYDNFYLDLFQSFINLENSLLSDRRETILFEGFGWITPFWGIQYEMRCGFKRSWQPPYFEYQITSLSRLSGLWDLKIAYQKREDDHRFALYFSMNLGNPKKLSSI